jgi:hypothetical protein
LGVTYRLLEQPKPALHLRLQLLPLLEVRLQLGPFRALGPSLASADRT